MTVNLSFSMGWHVPDIDSFYTELHQTTSESRDVHDAPTPTSSEFREFLKNNVGDTEPSSRALDIGCGATAIHALSCAKHGFARVDAVDINQRSLAFARTLAGKREETRDIHFTEGSALELPFDDNSMDLAVLLGVIHHTDKPKAALEEAARVLKPGGIAYLGVYCFQDSWFHWLIWSLRLVSYVLPFRVAHFVFRRSVTMNDFFLDHMYVPTLWLFRGQDIEDYVSTCGMRVEAQWPSKFDTLHGKSLLGRSLTGDGLYRIFVCRKLPDRDIAQAPKSNPDEN